MVLTLIWWDRHCDTSPPVSASRLLRLQWLALWPIVLAEPRASCKTERNGHTTIWSLYYGNFRCWSEKNVTSEWIRVRATTLDHQGPPVSKYSVCGRQALHFGYPRKLNKQTNKWTNKPDFWLEWCLWFQLLERLRQEDHINKSPGEHRSCLKNKEEIRSLSLSHRHSNSTEMASDLETCIFQKLQVLLTHI